MSTPVEYRLPEDQEAVGERDRKEEEERLVGEDRQADRELTEVQDMDLDEEEEEEAEK